VFERKLLRSGRIVGDDDDGTGFGNAGAQVIGVAGRVDDDDVGRLRLHQGAGLGITPLAYRQDDHDRASESPHGCRSAWTSVSLAHCSASVLVGLIVKLLVTSTP
jgi:hypothetical protein